MPKDYKEVDFLARVTKLVLPLWPLKVKVLNPLIKWGVLDNCQAEGRIGFKQG